MLPRERLLQCESYLIIAGVSLKDNAQMGMLKAAPPFRPHFHIIDNMCCDHADASHEYGARPLS
jgi:hypothetical protein